MKLKVGTRGSALAVAQTMLVLNELKKLWPDLEWDIKTIKTSGDMGMEVVGAFVKEVEIALREKEIDLAVHSLKDMPTELPGGVIVASIPKRGEHRDCLVSKHNLRLEDLPQGAKVGTSSLRRVYQLKKLRPDLDVQPIRGNIITRINKIDAGVVDAVVLAAAGLERVGMLERVCQIFTLEEIVPAVSQGALALEVREDDEETKKLVKLITDKATEQAVKAERAFLMALGGGCRMPIGAFGETKGDSLLLTGYLSDESGKKFVTGNLQCDPEDAETAGKRLAEKLIKRLSTA